MHFTKRQPSGQATPRNLPASQLTVDSSAAPTSQAQNQGSSRSLACRTEHQPLRSPASGSPRTPSSSGVSRPPWNSSPRVAEGSSSPRVLPSSHSSSPSSRHNMISAEVSMNGSGMHGDAQSVHTPGSQSKRPHLTDSLSGSEQVLGLVKEYIAPGSSEQQEKQWQQLDHKVTQPSTDPVPVPPLPRELLPPVGVSPELTADHLAVLGAWYCLYCPQKEAQQVAALTRHYDAKASFEDNFVQAFGRDQLGVQFYGMRRLVKGITLGIEKVEVLTDTGKHSKDTYQLRIISRISFYFPALIRGPVTSLFLPPAVEAWATDTLTVRQSDHTVVHHQQRIHNIPTFPWPLRAYAGFTSSLFMMHVLGW